VLDSIPPSMGNCFYCDLKCHVVTPDKKCHDLILKNIKFFNGNYNDYEKGIILHYEYEKLSGLIKIDGKCYQFESNQNIRDKHDSIITDKI